MLFVPLAHTHVCVYQPRCETLSGDDAGFDPKHPSGSGKEMEAAGTGTSALEPMAEAEEEKELGKDTRAGNGWGKRKMKRERNGWREREPERDTEKGK